MKTDLEKYVFKQMQDIEDNLLIDDWDDFAKQYARHKQIKRIGNYFSVIAAAVVFIGFLFFSMNELNVKTRCQIKNYTLPTGTAETAISINVPQCSNDLKSYLRINKPLTGDLPHPEEVHYYEDSLNTAGNITEASKATMNDTKSRQIESKNFHDLDSGDTPLPVSKSRAIPDFSIALSGGPGLTSNRNTSLIQFNSPTDGILTGTKEDVQYSHKPPLTFGVSVEMDFGKRISVTTGLNYSLYISQKEIKASGLAKSETQQLHYIGLPLRCDFTLISHNSFKWYIGAGLQIDKCIYAKTGENILREQQLLWSATAATGIQYNVTKSFSLYCEPYCSYLLNESAFISYRTDNPLTISANIGIRFRI